MSATSWSSARFGLPWITIQSTQFRKVTASSGIASLGFMIFSNL